MRIKRSVSAQHSSPSWVSARRKRQQRQRRRCIYLCVFHVPYFLLPTFLLFCFFNFMSCRVTLLLLFCVAVAFAAPSVTVFPALARIASPNIVVAASAFSHILVRLIFIDNAGRVCFGDGCGMSCRNYHTSPACKRAASASGAVAATRNGRIRFDIVCQRCRRMSHCVTHPHIHTHNFGEMSSFSCRAFSAMNFTLSSRDGRATFPSSVRSLFVGTFFPLFIFVRILNGKWANTKWARKQQRARPHPGSLSISHRRQTTSATHCQMPELTIKHLNGRLLINKVVRKCAIRVIFRVTCSTFRLCHRKRINHKLSACKRLVGCVCVCATHQIGYAMSVFVSVFFSILFHWWISIMARGGSVGMRARVKLSVIYDPSPPSCHLCA